MSESGEYLRKGPHEACGSSDANAHYADGNTHCFSCGVTERSQNSDELQGQPMIKEFNPSFIEYPNSIRGIHSTTLKKFTYGVSNGTHVTYYYDTTGNIIAEKRRTKDKDFSWTGNAKKASLFGQSLWKPNKKISITITEGEIDAMVISQNQNNMYPVVSVPNGAAAAMNDVKKQLEWLLKFKEVVLCFDNDTVGQEAALAVASLFPPKFVRIATLPLKDACEMLDAGKANGTHSELQHALRDAKHFTPDGILSGNDIIDKLENEEEVESFPFPEFMYKANDLLGGIRMTDLMTITAGTGSGKTSLIKQLQYHYYQSTDMNQALIHLEEPLTKTAKDLVGITMDTRLHLDKSVDKETYMKKAKELFGATDSEGHSRFCIYDTFGAMDSQDLYNKIRFMVKGLDCKIVWLDHLTILVSDLGEGTDERRAIDTIMLKLKSLAMELDCFIGLIVHLNNNTQTPFEEGGQISLNNLRGSGAIKQISDSVLAMSRNQLEEDKVARNTTKLTILKNRFSGITGPAGSIFYNEITGRFEKVEDKEFEGETIAEF